MKFIHTADWQIGKPFARIRDDGKRTLVQQERIESIKRVGHIAQEKSASFVLVAGDLFDSISPKKSVVSAACSAIGEILIPVIVIPGNHDHGGPGSIWEQEFFLREKDELAPNMVVLLEPKPYELDDAIIYPCPLTRRIDISDPTEWLRNVDVFKKEISEKPRIALVHGSTQSFVGLEDEEEIDGSISNLIGLDRLPMDQIDYIALGDWHGTKQVGPKAWYAGTPEIDRFPKGEGNNPGNVLLVDINEDKNLNVTPFQTSRLGWNEFAYDISDDSAIASFQARIGEQIGLRVNEHLLKLALTGTLGIEASNELENIIESLEARLLRLKLDNQTVIAPTDDEIEAMTQQQSDPLIAHVALRLIEKINSTEDDSKIAATALRELHAVYQKEELT